LSRRKNCLKVVTNYYLLNHLFTRAHRGYFSINFSKGSHVQTEKYLSDLTFWWKIKTKSLKSQTQSHQNVHVSKCCHFSLLITICCHNLPK